MGVRDSPFIDHVISERRLTLKFKSYAWIYYFCIYFSIEEGEGGEDGPSNTPAYAPV